MTIFDLLFIVLFLTAFGALVTAAVVGVRGPRGAARRILRRLGLSVAAYLGVVAIVAVASPRRFLAIGDEECSDDWCIAVTGVQKRPAPVGMVLELTFRLSSRARRVAQREQGVVVYLLDDRGRRYDPDPAVIGIPFDMRLEPLQEVTTTRAFSVPADAAVVGVVVSREGSIAFPRCCIIGDEGSLFHKKTIVRLG